MLKPFVKWAGGKRQILPLITRYIEDAIDENNRESYTYIEPFLGGGAVFLSLEPKRAIINDLNADLINAYRVISSDDYVQLIAKLKEYDAEYRQDRDGFYYDIRSLDRDPNWKETAGPIDRAARMIFLNRTCFNGLYRVNGKGEFNTPIGRYINPTICDEATITALHLYLSSPNNTIQILNGSYEIAFNQAKDGDVIYADPPYDYNDDDGFTKYQMEGFTFEDFERLKHKCDEAIERGAIVIISNNATEKVLNLFLEDPKYKVYYQVTRLSTLRRINCKASQRQTGDEVVIVGEMNSLPQANDIEKVIMLASKFDEQYLQDTSQICKDLSLGTERQVAYYLAALQFLNLITHDRTATPLLNSASGDKSKIEHIIFNQLRGDKIFKTAFEKYCESGSISITDIEMLIANKHDALSPSTVRRRASTIKAWLEWMIQYNNVQ